MKTLRALFYWMKGWELTRKDQRRVEDLYGNVKAIVLTTIIGLLILWLCSTSGCFSERLNFGV